MRNHELSAQNKRDTDSRFRTSLAAAGVNASVTDPDSLAALHASLPEFVRSFDNTAEADAHHGTDDGEEAPSLALDLTNLDHGRPEGRRRA